MLTTIFWGCAAVSTAVFAVMLYSVATFRRVGDHALAERRAFTEVIWTAIPIVIFILAAVPAVRMIGG
jgi:heme/copper-type cytochrome/quinol oxidase subunit 2